MAAILPPTGGDTRARGETPINPYFSILISLRARKMVIASGNFTISDFNFPTRAENGAWKRFGNIIKPLAPRARGSA
jgi:hypothetical protein